MAIALANVATSNTFQVWLDTTNFLATYMTNSVVTVNSTFSTTTGNGAVVGNFGATTLFANSALRGGNASVSSTLAISSNTTISGTANVSGQSNFAGLVNAASLSVTGVADVFGAATFASTVNAASIGVAGQALFFGATSAANLTTTTNTLTVGTGSYFVSNGNVGIGTSSPGAKLTVSGDISATSNTLTVGTGSFFVSNGNVGIGVSAPGSKLTVNGDILTTSNTLTVGTGSFFVSNGNVGIANTAPNAKLTVTGTANVSGNVAIGGTLSVTGDTIVMPSSFLRNRIINGDMRIDQRNNGGAVNISNTASGGYPVDRFRVNAAVGAGALGVIQAQRIALGAGLMPIGFNSSLRCTVTTADTSVGSTEEYFILQFIEGFNFADLTYGISGALPITISFWVNSSVTGSFGFSLKNANVTRSYPTSYTINNANTWEFKTITIPGDTTGTWNTTNGKGAECHWSLGAGSPYKTTGNTWASGNFNSATGTVNLISTTLATFYLTGVQVEVGSVATPFERRHYGQELALCHRYYYGSEFTSFGGSSAWFKQSMRATPTMTVTGGGSAEQISTECFRPVQSEVSYVTGTFRADAEFT